jgi:toxin ParE1/3/4
LAEYRLRPSAEEDMLGIWQYSMLRWSEQQADKYANALFDAMQALADDPARGSARDEVRAGLRRYARGSHVIFYVADEAGAEIVRVLHASMDFSVHFANDEP